MPGEERHPNRPVDSRTTRSESLISRVAAESEVPALTILWHPDRQRIGETSALSGMLSGDSQPLSRLEPLFAPPDGHREPQELGEVHLSRQPVSLTLQPDGSIVLARQQAKTRIEIKDRSLAEAESFTKGDIARGVVILLARRVALLLHRVRLGLRPPPITGLVGESDAMVALRHEIRDAAQTSRHVLLRGATGTGKELVSRALHDASGRRTAPYVTVNAAAIAPAQATAELFGAARGAYSGADRDRKGYFQRADGGTLFLDEVGEVSPEVQGSLLRVLETGEIQPVGAQFQQTVDVRVVAATDSDLDAKIAAGAFSRALSYRLMGHEIDLPPLIDRQGDFGRLFVHFLRQHTTGGTWDQSQAPEQNPWASAAPLISKLSEYQWPGNVRELRSLVGQLAAACQGPTAEVRLTEKVESFLRRSSVTTAGRAPTKIEAAPRANYRSPDAIDEDEMISELQKTQWNVRRAATALGVSRTTLYELMRRSPRVRSASELDREEIERVESECDGDLDLMASTLQVSKRGLQLRRKKLGID